MRSASPDEIKSRLKKAGYKLGKPAKPLASYQPAVRTDTMLATAGHLPMVNGELTCTGRVGSGRGPSPELAAQAAEDATLAMLASAVGLITDDERLAAMKVTVFIAADDDFIELPSVANGASHIIRIAFDDVPSRSAVGVRVLPLGATVEVEGIFEISED